MEEKLFLGDNVFHPREKAADLLKKLEKQLIFLSVELPIDCECVDHIGPHQVHLSRTILLSNFKVLYDHIEYAASNKMALNFISAVIDVIEAEVHRQSDLLNELPVLTSRYWSRKTKIHG